MTNRRDTCPWWKTVRCSEIAPDTLQVAGLQGGGSHDKPSGHLSVVEDC